MSESGIESRLRAPPPAACLEALAAESIFVPLRRAGERASLAVWWVGGGVRDRLRGDASADIDLVVEGELDLFLPALAEVSELEVETRTRFETTKIRVDGRRADLARSRREIYSAPGALPRVSAASIEDDLARRDFSINAMALAVTAPAQTRFLDPFGGQADLGKGQLRILHTSSFADDPTRILRGIDFAARFGFDFDAATERAARQAIRGGALLTLSPERLGTALARMLSRPGSVLAAIDRATELGVLIAIDPQLTWTALARTRLESALVELRRFSAEAAVRADTYALALLALAEGGEPQLAAQLGDRLALNVELRSIVERRALNEARTAGIESSTSPSIVHRLLELLQPVELAWLATVAPHLRPWTRRELESMRGLRLRISGDDLLREGVAAGPELGRGLELTLAARLDGEIGVSDELDFALRTIRAGRHGGTRA